MDQRRLSVWVGLCVWMGVLGGWNGSVWADPCGMVPPPPPPYLQNTTLIERVGAQKTYVFYKNGIESFVIRPGFSGKVDNFGMLIPFPTAPAIRKVPDEIFSHIASAIDPPEVVVQVQQTWRRWGPVPTASGMAQAKPSAAPSRRRLDINAVRVIRKEAIGMYQVAVLEAGSPKALKRWMTRNGYRYPSGMDKVCLEYIEAGWVFVAVKARVASSKSISPRPGLRSVRPTFPKGGTFKGNVQAMGFRFRSRRLVVPMRLSAYNKGRLHNIVYLLTTGPRHIRKIPKSFVMRQVRGRELLRNVTEPLPVRVQGGPPSMIQRWQWDRVQALRNPSPHNGFAAELFASDLLAARTGKLALPYEEHKKILLNISERLELRGKHIDPLHRTVLEKESKDTVAKAVSDLRSMTLTIVDGDFKREVLAKDNLTFAQYSMPSKCNKSGFYNARTLSKASCSGAPVSVWGTVYRRKGPGFRAFRDKFQGQQRAPRRSRRLRSRELYRLIRQLSNPKRADKALTKLIRAGAPAIPYLQGEAIEGNNLLRRGWSMVGLAEIGLKQGRKGLEKVYNDNTQHALVRNWAAATQIRLTPTLEELSKITQVINLYPALKRPLTRQIQRIAQRGKPSHIVAGMLLLISQAPTFRTALYEPLLSFPPRLLIAQMLRSKSQVIRQNAAAYSGVQMQRNRADVTKELLGALRYRKSAKRVPWAGGALYLPGWPILTAPPRQDWVWQHQLRNMSYLAWDTVERQLPDFLEKWKQTFKTWKEQYKQWETDTKLHTQETRNLIQTLLAWGIWSKQRNQPAELKKILINLQSSSILRAAAWTLPPINDDIDGWLDHWGRTFGYSKLEEWLRTLGVADQKNYQIDYIKQTPTRYEKRLRERLGPFYVGCYRDHYYSRDLPFYAASYQTPDGCRQICARRGFSYAGLQYGYQCYCGHRYGRYGKAQDIQCRIPCTYQRHLMCGGSNHNSVYRVK